MKATRCSWSETLRTIHFQEIEFFNHGSDGVHRSFLHREEALGGPCAPRAAGARPRSNSAARGAAGPPHTNVLLDLVYAGNGPPVPFSQKSRTWFVKRATRQGFCPVLSAERIAPILRSNCAA